MKVHTLVGGVVGTNCYVVEDENKNCLIVDIADLSGERIADFLESNDLRPQGVLLTHGHFDHASGVPAFRGRFQVPVYGHSADFHSESLTKRPYSPLADVISVMDGETLKIGNFHVEVLHTPGHTPGSVCYLIGDNVFAGDTLFAGDIGRTDFKGGSMDEMRKSLKKLAAIEKDYKVFPGHEESTTLSEEKAHNPYLK